MADTAAGFGTALFGFQKKNVLACIERMSAENLKVQKDAEEKIQELQGGLDASRVENNALKQQASENTNLISQLVNQAKQYQQQLEQLEKSGEELQQQNEALKKQLFSTGEENVRLKHSGEQLAQQFKDKQEQLNRQNARMAELKKTCEERLQQIDAEHGAKLEQLRQEAEKRVQAAEGCAGFRAVRSANIDVSGSLLEVHRDLAAVGENIERVSGRLEHSMQLLENALRQAESIRQESMPHAAGPKTLPKEEPFSDRSRKPEPPKRAVQSAAPATDSLLASTVAERLLDKLAKLLEQ